MPLSRYEIRSEYSLANPDLYRAADKDDPEGLLEGVAMAGLVGIIRQLGDLAEFAAEVFHDLHEDVLATAARGHELLLRVRHLEREVPLIENFMFIKTDGQNFVYNPGVEWHVHIHNEQNHFTQGDLPRFIRSAYEDCKSPPRLFVLDRFDGTGAGACLKRFTDPSFFKMEWASSELMKAEKEQQDHKARRLTKKGRRQGNGEAREARLASHMRLRVPSEVENSATSSIPSSSSSSNSSGLFEQETLDILKQENEDMLTASSSLFSGQEGPQLKGINVEEAKIEELPRQYSTFNQELSIMGTCEDVGLLSDGLGNGLKEVEEVADDDSATSETDNFMDAVTTMDSEVETDTEIKPGVEVDVDFLANVAENEAPLPQPISELSRGAGGEQVLVEDDVEHSIRGDLKDTVAIGEDCSSAILMPEELCGDDSPTGSLKEKHLCSLVYDAPTLFPKLRDLSFVNGEVVTIPAQTIDVLTPNSSSSASSSGVEEDAVTKLEELLIDNVSRVYPEEEIFLSLDKSLNMPSTENNGVSTSVNQSGASSPVLQEKVLLSKCLQPESKEHVFTTSETLEANNKDKLLGDRTSAQFNQLEGSSISGSQNQSPKNLGAASTRKRWQINQLSNKPILPPDLGIDGSQVSESEQGESPKKLYSNSSPSSSIEPIRWAVRSPKCYHTDDGIDGLQGSLGSLSCSSSTLSSPRPSTLTTTLQSLNLEGKPRSPPFRQKSADSPPPALSPSKSGITTGRYEQVSLVKPSAESVMSPASEHSGHSSPHSSSSAVQPFFDSLPSLVLSLNTSTPEKVTERLSTLNVGGNNLDNFPPPPPLPPLAWRMTRRSRSAVVCPSEPIELPIAIPCQGDVEIHADEPPQVSTPLTTVPATFHDTGVRHMPDDSTQSFMHETCPSEIKALHENSDEYSKAPKPAGSEGRHVPTLTSNTENSQEECISVLAPSRGKIGTALPDSSFQEKLLDGSNHTLLTRVLQTESTPASQDFPANLERKESSAEASTSRDVNRLKRRSKWALTSSTASSDDREVLLEQIRTRSFSLRNASAEKLPAPRAVTNINVAAILEKANAIRQAFAGSDEDDEDDEWSDV